jgi:alcohol dehydrogenase class IV
LGIRRAALFTDRRLRELPWFAELTVALHAAGIDAAVFDEVAIEPTDVSFEAAARFATEARPDGYISLGGGSVIDTCKAANLLATYPARLSAYANAPLGDARAIPGALAPHVACPTTSGTGSEVTGIAIFDWLAHETKTGIASARLRPSEAIVDPRCALSLPAQVVAASGMDVLCHAIESFTARPFSRRTRPVPPTTRPMSQGANPWSDLGCREALRLCGRYLERAVRDASDSEAREQMMWAATLAGIAFGNAGVHAPHAMAYAVAGRARAFYPPGYPAGAPLVPHGIAVAVSAPAVFRLTAATSPERHREAAALLGELDGEPSDLLAAAVIRLMRAIELPNGIAGVGYTSADIDTLVEGTLPQQRLLTNAPCELARPTLASLFATALSYW